MQKCSNIRMPCHLLKPFEKAQKNTGQTLEKELQEPLDTGANITIVLPPTDAEKAAPKFQWKYPLLAFVLGYLIAKNK